MTEIERAMLKTILKFGVGTPTSTAEIKTEAKNDQTLKGLSGRRVGKTLFGLVRSGYLSVVTRNESSVPTHYQIAFDPFQTADQISPETTDIILKVLRDSGTWLLSREIMKCVAESHHKEISSNEIMLICDRLAGDHLIDVDTDPRGPRLYRINEHTELAVTTHTEEELMSGQSANNAEIYAELSSVLSEMDGKTREVKDHALFMKAAERFRLKDMRPHQLRMYCDTHPDFERRNGKGNNTYYCLKGCPKKGNQPTAEPGKKPDVSPEPASAKTGEPEMNATGADTHKPPGLRILPKEDADDGPAKKQPEHAASSIQQRIVAVLEKNGSALSSAKIADLVNKDGGSPVNSFAVGQICRRMSDGNLPVLDRSIIHGTKRVFRLAGKPTALPTARHEAKASQKTEPGHPSPIKPARILSRREKLGAKEHAVYIAASKLGDWFTSEEAANLANENVPGLNINLHEASHFLAKLVKLRCLGRKVKGSHKQRFFKKRASFKKTMTKLLKKQAPGAEICGEIASSGAWPTNPATEAMKILDLSVVSEIALAIEEIGSIIQNRVARVHLDKVLKAAVSTRPWTSKEDVFPPELTRALRIIGEEKKLMDLAETINDIATVLAGIPQNLWSRVLSEAKSIAKI